MSSPTRPSARATCSGSRPRPEMTHIWHEAVTHPLQDLCDAGRRGAVRPFPLARRRSVCGRARRRRGRPTGGGPERRVDTLRLTAEEATGLLERKEVSAAELHAAYLGAVAERDAELHCYLRTVDEPVGDGVPIALKDVISTKGIETTAGSRILEGYVPVFDSTVAARCKAAGLPLIGKTNTDEFAMGSSTENSAYGPSRNPWDPERVPGGSGGGSAAAVSGGLAPWALGSDTGGSIKQPSALCGNVGLRPTYGTVSRYGIVAFASSLDQVGPVAKNVRDCALLYSIIAGKDPCDSTTVELPEPVRLPDAEDLKGVRIGVPREMNEAEGIEPGVAEAVRAAIDLASSLGADVERVRAPALGRVRPRLLLPDRARRGLREPRPLRRRPLRAAHRRRRLLRDGRAHARRRLRRRAEAPHHARHLRALGRLLRGVLRPGAEGAHGDRARARRRVRALRRARLADLADGRVQGGGEGGEPARDVPLRPAHDPVVHGRAPRPEHPVRSLGRPARRPPADRAAVLREHALPHGPRARAGACLRSRSESACDDLAARRRPRDPRPAEDALEDVLRLPERLRRRREHANLPGLPRLSRRAAGAEQDRDRVDAQARARARLRDRAARRLRAQELRLPRPAEGLSDLTI